MTDPKRTAVAAACCLASALACTETPTTVISGTLVGHDDNPIAVAHVHAFEASAEQPFLSVAVQEDGSYELTTVESGALMIRFTGVGHDTEEMPLYVDSSLSVEVDVRLAAVEYVDDFSGVKALIKVGDDSTREAPLEQRADGIMTVAVESADPELSYVLTGATAWGWCHGTDSEQFEYHPVYGYASILSVDTGWAQITFEPGKLVRGSESPDVRVSPETSREARLYTIWREGVERAQSYHEAQAAGAATPGADTAFVYDWSAELATLESQLAAEHDPLLRQMLLLSRISIADLDADVEPAAIQQALTEISPTSLVWGYGASLIPSAVFLAARGDSAHSYDEYLEQVVGSHPNEHVRKTVLWLALWHADDAADTAKTEKYYDRLVTDHPDSWQADWARSRFSPDRNIMVGKPIPDFALESLEDSGMTYTRAGLAGTVYLIDFWATWCAPCVAEMPNIHDAHEKYKDRGFEVLSVAIQDTRQNISEFRERWPMPWLHAMYEWSSAAIAPFELGPIPAGMLVDQHGNIAALDAGIRGERLHEALDRLVGEKR